VGEPQSSADFVCDLQSTWDLVQPWSRLPWRPVAGVPLTTCSPFTTPLQLAAPATPLERYCDLDEMYARSALMSAGLSLCSGMGML
jgi:hypothetical protein